MSSPRRPSQQLHREVRFDEVRYDFYICKGPDSWHDLRSHLAKLDTDLFVLIADQGLRPAAVAEVESHFKAIAPTLVIPTLANERVKRLGTIDELAELALRGGVTRQSCVVALGGGVVGNMAGLLAGLLYRGIRFVHLPTTLLSMSDSVLSMKQGVNSRQGKNLLGLFHPPIFVWNQLDFLDSLPVEAIKSALCETVKNVITICPERCDEVAGKLRPDGCYSAEVITEFIELCVDTKMKVMRNDPREKGDARILEYGHTVGHAVELLSEGKIHHGFAIGLGMLAAARVAGLLGYLDSKDESLHRELLLRNGAPIALPKSIDIQEIMRTIGLDNKRGYVRPKPGKCDFILLDGLGKPHRGKDGGLITQVDEELVRAGIESIKYRKPARIG
ncbi:MAG TPA: 2-deoxy-scyllo-inosose synthase [Gemmataceae bacterium]|jgi:3-dehydroquinate synthase/2-deoxy-scyllo-inosose synthase|nr:2-deoxy-scyllo-inosose synthase [Gemmataceae bacterium]